ncbi:MAG: hypothetical protein Q7T25_02940, partial [Sideroxyarcus sp.]|nr:hypothetical protein [Sideroxyarcus sp.]
MTPTLSQTPLFGLLNNRQPGTRNDNSAATNAPRKSHDALIVVTLESAPGNAAFIHANPWMAPKKKGRVAMSVVVVFHLALAWGLQSGLRQVKQIQPAKNVLMTYIAPAHPVQAPVQKPLLKTLTVATPVIQTPSLMPVAPAPEHAIETAMKPAQVTASQSAEVLTSPAPVSVVP